MFDKKSSESVIIQSNQTANGFVSEKSKEIYQHLRDVASADDVSNIINTVIEIHQRELSEDKDRALHNFQIATKQYEYFHQKTGLSSPIDTTSMKTGEY